MHEEQRDTTTKYLTSLKMPLAIFANPTTITWLTGVEFPFLLGQDVFSGGPPLLIYEQGEYTLVLLEDHAANTAGFASQPGCQVETYSGYSLSPTLAGEENLTDLLRRLLKSNTGRKGRCGLELQTLPVRLYRTIRELWSLAELVPLDHWLEPFRMVKSEEEIALLRRNFALCDSGHTAASKTICPGIREIDLWTNIQQAVDQKAGKRVPLGSDCAVGTREMNMGGMPEAHTLKPGCSIIVDLGTCLDGYWGDSCATYYASQPDDRQIAMHQAVTDTLEYAISLILPGAVAGEVDQKVRQFLEMKGFCAYPHHTGHGVGVSSHEAPRIVPYSRVVLQPGMVIMLEPGIYLPGQTAVRLEDAVLVTTNGPEVLTHHRKDIPFVAGKWA